MTEYETDLFHDELRRYAAKLYAGTDAETFIAGAAEDLIDEGITFITQEPKKIARIIAVLNDNTTFPSGEDEDDRGAVVREDADGFLLTTSTGEIRFTAPEDALDAAGLLTLSVSGHRRRCQVA